MPIKVLATLAAAAAGGQLFLMLNIPVPWLLGSLTGALAWRRLRPAAVCWSPSLHSFGQIVLGYVMGRPFTPEVGHYVAFQLPLMLAATLALVLFCLVLGYVTHRQTGLSLATSVLATVPGGLVQMVVLAGEIAAADVSVVTFMQTLRMLAVVFTVPFLAMHSVSPQVAATVAVLPAAPAAVDSAALLVFIPAAVGGALLSVRLRLPTPYLLGPMLATVALAMSGQAAPAAPSWLVTAAQVAVGAHLGCGVDFAGIGDWRKMFSVVLFNVAAIIVFCLAIACFLADAIPTAAATAFLSTAPGGIAEMGVTALLLGADISVVVGYQMFRILFILLVLPLFLRHWLRTEKGAEG